MGNRYEIVIFDGNGNQVFEAVYNGSLQGAKAATTKAVKAEGVDFHASDIVATIGLESGEIVSQACYPYHNIPGVEWEDC